MLLHPSHPNSVSSAEPYVLVWSAQDAKEKLENLIVIRTTFLAPFLFGEQTFCDEVRTHARQYCVGRPVLADGLSPIKPKY